MNSATKANRCQKIVALYVHLEPCWAYWSQTQTVFTPSSIISSADVHRDLFPPLSSEELPYVFVAFENFCWNSLMDVLSRAWRIISVKCVHRWPEEKYSRKNAMTSVGMSVSNSTPIHLFKTTFSFLLIESLTDISKCNIPLISFILHYIDSFISISQYHL